MGFEAPADVPAFQQAVIAHGDKPVFLKFSADWCMPCQSIAADLDALSEEFKDKMGFIYVPVDVLEDVAQLYEVTDLPTFIVIKNLQATGKAYGTKVDKVRQLIEDSLK